jgi:hypothetical protein
MDDSPDYARMWAEAEDNLADARVELRRTKRQVTKLSQDLLAYRRELELAWADLQAIADMAERRVTETPLEAVCRAFGSSHQTVREGYGRTPQGEPAEPAYMASLIREGGIVYEATDTYHSTVIRIGPSSLAKRNGDVWRVEKLRPQRRVIEKAVWKDGRWYPVRAAADGTSADAPTEHDRKLAATGCRGKRKLY